MRPWLAWCAAVFLAMAVPLTVAPGQRIGQAASAATKTVVSLTFDDGQASQAAAASMLASRGMTGTFYINSAMVGTSPYYMTWPQIHSLADAGHEIGGHTLHHANLANLSPSTAQADVCSDRKNLVNRGFSPVESFAYPEAGVDAGAKQAVQDCGYTTGRSVGNIFSSRGPYAETIPPEDAFDLKTPDGVTANTTLSQLKSYVTGAETHGGGWVILTFHGICDNRCTAGNSLGTATFAAFLDWLHSRSAHGTVVRTVGEVMGFPTPEPRPSPGSRSTSPSCPYGSM
jgi:peptidoglycan/xylan/chitin deacetylase (PgdA/CDA1 family)